MGEVKSVMVVTVDWGRDINPWYTKTIACAIDYFVIQDLNALFLATNASCSRAKNGKVHKWLSGVALPHNHLGSHLNTQRETTDKQSKIKKFSHTEEILVEICLGMIIDDYPLLDKIISEYNADNILQNLKNLKQFMNKNHSILYKLKRIKITICCTLFRSPSLTIIKERFLPPPVSISRSNRVMKWLK